MYDVIIIGGGPAGLTAGIYAVRRGLKTLIIEKTVPGGQMLLTREIENWPGDKLVSGTELAKRMEEHAKSLGVEFLLEEVLGVEVKKEKKIVSAKDKKLECRAIILATGGEHRHLGVSGEEEFLGKGVSYCATCDAPFFRDKAVAVIGGGNSAIEDAIYMTSVAGKTFLIHRKDRLRAEERRQSVFTNKGGTIILNTVVDEVRGDEAVKKIMLKNVNDGRVTELAVGGVFISIGVVPVSRIAKDAGVELDDNGCIKVDRNQCTNVPGVFACGDVTGGVLQIAAAVGEGCRAGLSAYDFIRKPYWSGKGQ